MSDENTTHGDGPILHCLASGQHDLEPALTLGMGLPTTHNSLPIHYRWADALKIGEKYTHPTKGYEVDASSANVKTIEDSFAKMKANGVESPFVTDHHMGAKNTLGYVQGTRRKDGWLQVQLGIVGDDSLNVACKNKISLGIRPMMRDSHKNTYELAIEHCAATPAPVVHGQGQLLAASRADGPELIYLSAAPETPIAPERSDVMKKEHREKAMKLLAAKKIPSDADDDAVMDHLLEEHGKEQASNENMQSYCRNLSMNDLIESDGMSAEDKVKLAGRQKFMPILADGVMSLSRHSEKADLELSRAQSQILTLSRSDAPDPELLHERQLRLADKFDLLAERSIYTPADVKKIKDTVLGATGAPNTFMLSREDGQTDCVAGLLAEVLLDCRPAPKPGDVTGAYNLSRSLPQSGGGGEQEREITSPFTGEKVKVPTING